MPQLDEFFEPMVQFNQACEIQLGFQGKSVVRGKGGNGWVAMKSAQGNLVVSFATGSTWEPELAA